MSRLGPTLTRWCLAAVYNVVHRPRRAAGVDVGGVDPDDLADARQALAEATRWQHDADTKAGLLSAALALAVGATAQQARSLPDAPPVGLVIFGALCTALVMSAVCLAYAVVPRTPPAQSPSRFSLSALSSPRWRRPPASGVDVAGETWREAHTVACIARTKYRALRLGSIAVYTALPLCLAFAITGAMQ